MAERPDKVRGVECMGVEVSATFDIMMPYRIAS